MQVFDASSMIHAWDNYPLRQFPGLWDWLGARIAEREIQMPRIAFDEISHKSPECCDWLKSCGIELIDVGNEIALQSLRIKELLGIVNDNYHPKGVDENDLLIIATARVSGAELISDESRQKLPDVPAKRKIPIVCEMKEVDVPCMNFIDYIKQADAIFR